VLKQVKCMMEGYVETLNGTMLPLVTDTICVHGDHPTVVETLKLIRNTIENNS
ncbi:MAG: LamB/YcsF family protein, partial [Saprospiraceae bacterium]|nr:LamB/YcsF family protein [Saprospiraceae bacterium]